MWSRYLPAGAPVVPPQDLASRPRRNRRSATVRQAFREVGHVAEVAVVGGLMTLNVNTRAVEKQTRAFSHAWTGRQLVPVSLILHPSSLTNIFSLTLMRP